MILRDATADDVPAIARVMGDWCRDTPWVPKLHTPDQDLWFVGKLLTTHVMRLGFAGGPEDPEHLGFLARQGSRVDALYLAPGARGRGLGATLLAEVKALGLVQLWTFEANHDARRFYLREGFREVRRTDGADNDEKLPDIWMEWRA